MHYYTDVLKKYAVFSGRATRTEFWMFTLWNTIVAIVLAIIESLLVRATGTNAFMFIMWVYALAIILPSIGVSLRRLHDAGFSGWWILIDLVPFIGAIVLIIMYVQPSKAAPSMADVSSPSSPVI